MKYINEETLNNIFDKYSSCLGIVSRTDILNKNGKSFGQVVLLINLKYKKKFIVGDMVEFPVEKTKWNSSYFDEQGKSLYIVNAHWVKPFINDLKVNVPVSVQISEEVNGVRKYKITTETQKMYFKQFLIRRMIELTSHLPHGDVAAVENLARRSFKYKDYYKALNETAKNYKIEHKKLKKMFSVYSNLKKKIIKEWEKYERQMLISNLSIQKIENLWKTFEDKEDRSKIIDIKKYK